MQPETPNGETPVVTDPKTLPNPTPAPQAQAPDPEIERLRKEAEQQKMRANQLENQLADKEKAEQDALDEKLKEQNKYKDLYEQEKTRREEIETAAEKAARESAVKAESDKLFGEYPEAVRALADDVGLKLEDADEDTVAAFKTKLESISGKIKQPKVTANNPNVNTPQQPETTSQEMHEIMRDPAKFQEYLQKNFKGVSTMMTKK